MARFAVNIRNQYVTRALEREREREYVTILG